MFSIHREADGTIKLVGKMHDAHTERVEEVFDAVTSSCTVDFTDLVYISSSGLGLLLRVQKRLEESNQKLVLKGMSQHVRELFSLTRFDLIFKIED